MNSNQTGFSLLEAMVALTLLSGAGLALFSWINTSLTQMQVASAYIRADQVVNSANAYLKTQDFMTRSEGVFSSSGVDIHWQVKRLEDEMRGAEGSNYTFSLYLITMTPSVDGRTLPSLETRDVRYKNIGLAEKPFG